MSPSADVTVANLRESLCSEDTHLPHELAYCLGQTGNLAAAKSLRETLENLEEDPMVRHEAAEALGALGDVDSLELLRRYRDREGESVAVKETCEIAIDRLEWESSEQRKAEKLKQSLSSSDTVPCLPSATWLHPDLPTAEPAVLALAEGFKDTSELFRHEVAFVFGQLSHPASIPALTAALSDTNEASMVRHEAAEALGSLGDEEGVEDTLRKFLDDAEKVVRESVIVALDMAEYERSNTVEYALIPESAQASA
ncbi:unnamed protein product [Parascedosporium putredinis]|uniref:Deoxyhypusine monooxygenase n=1 Tax=Parascedosporium putredinis TaxID=1442378 RepID=A0A9P1H1C7_9PEZI|nr:unnamed protein product [Parascedosporium putredinis]CAI7995034.1 unnamed protein product [Parascedosporium putredinis]